jgi:glycerol-3-phosphate acyltransferase PlsY
MISTNLFIVILTSYLLGSIPFAVIIARISGIGDITKHGSGNPGATNMLRLGGKKLGAINFLLDFAKGTLAVKIGEYLGHEQSAFVAVVVGHCFSIFLRGKGGKGVATTLGGLFGLNPVAGALAIGVWVAVFAAFRISSLSAISAFSITTIAAAIFWCSQVFWAMLPVTVLVIYRHKANIKRLLDGSEK